MYNYDYNINKYKNESNFENNVKNVIPVVSKPAVSGRSRSPWDLRQATPTTATWQLQSLRADHQTEMKLIIRDTSEDVTEWAAKYVIKRINAFKPGPGKMFVLGLPTGGTPQKPLAKGQQLIFLRPVPIDKCKDWIAKRMLRWGTLLNRGYP